MMARKYDICKRLKFNQKMERWTTNWWQGAKNYIKKQEKVEKDKKKSRRTRTGIRLSISVIILIKGKFPEIEGKVFEWLKNQREKNVIMRLKDIKDTALSFITVESFTTSNGWFSGFAKWYQIDHRFIKALTYYLEEIQKKKFEIESLNKESKKK